MAIRSIFFSVFFLLIEVAIGIFPKPALADDVCPATVVVDVYYCKTQPSLDGTCGEVIRYEPFTNQSVDCGWDGNTCKSTYGVCSSNDSCKLNEAETACVCTGSPVDCSNPNPPPGCFLPGTIVNGPGGGKNIEEVRVGDSVDSFADNALTQSAVSQIYKVTREYYYSLVAGDYQVKVTAEHPFFVGNNEFKEVKDLKAGDDVYVIENGSLKKKTVTSNTRINEPTDAYNLSVDNTNTFFANDFAVHNKVQYSVDGSHDYVSCAPLTGGWACNENAPNYYFNAQLYEQPVDGGVLDFLGEVTANEPREAAVGDQCGGSTYHFQQLHDQRRAKPMRRQFNCRPSKGRSDCHFARSFQVSQTCFI